MATQFCAIVKRSTIRVGRLAGSGESLEVVDILAEGFHILAGVFERLTLHFGRDLVLIDRGCQYRE